MAGDAEIAEFDNLILDETRIERISADDKAYLEQFVKLEEISLINCALQTIENFPKIETLSKVELSDNFLKGSELSHLMINKNIQNLKLGNNKIAAVSELQCLSEMTKLVNLDLDGNPCCQTEEYKREAIFAMIPSLEVLDMKTKEGEDYFSQDDSDGEGFEFEEGEDEMDEQVAMLEAKLTDEQKKQLADAGVTLEQYLHGEGPELGI